MIFVLHFNKDRALMRDVFKKIMVKVDAVEAEVS